MVVRSVAVMLAGSWLAARMAQCTGLPYAIGSLVCGCAMGFIGVIEDGLEAASSDLRWMIFVTVLLRAGMGIKWNELRTAGATVALLSVLPILFEAAAISAVAKWYFGWPIPESGMLGCAIGPLSPALVLPGMLALSSTTTRREPKLVLMAAPLEVVFGTTAFSVFSDMFESSDWGGGKWWLNVLMLLLMVIGAMIVGCALGVVLDKTISFRDDHAQSLTKAGVGKHPQMEELLALLCFAFAANSICDSFNLSSVLAILAVPFVLAQRRGVAAGSVCQHMSQNLNKVWFFGELSLFFLIGAELDIAEIPKAGPSLPAILAIGMLARGVGVFLALANTDVPLSGRLFCWVAMMPKATVQAALGGQPLDIGVPDSRGQYILTASVVSVGIFATLGVILTSFGERKLGMASTPPVPTGDDPNPLPSAGPLAMELSVVPVKEKEPSESFV